MSKQSIAERQAARQRAAAEEAEEAAKEIAANLANVKPPPKTQSQGVMERIEGVGIHEIDLGLLRLPDVYARVPSEYKPGNKKFDDLLNEIRSSGRKNSTPIVVRQRESAEGPYYEVVAGTRRYHVLEHLRKEAEAIEKLKPVGERQRIQVKAVCQVEHKLSDLELDRAHVKENLHREDKSVLSSGRTFSLMLKSGRYESLRQMCTYLGVNAGNVSTAIGLLDDAPPGLWDAVVDPHEIRWSQAKKLLRAFKLAEFQDWCERNANRRELQAADLMAKVSDLLARQKGGEVAKQQTVVEQLRGGKYKFVLPEGVSESRRALGRSVLAKVIASDDDDDFLKQIRSLVG